MNLNRMFFPDPVFAWTFCVILILLTCVAAWTDTRRAKIPNRLTVAILALGLLINAVRGGWMASENKPLWVFDTGTAWIGVVDGLLYSVVGFVVFFALMFGIWVLGACGGGDVKLLASVAAWVGLWYFPLLWLASIGFLIVWMVARVAAGGKITRPGSKPGAEKEPKSKAPGKNQPPAPRQLRATYSLPFAVATAVVLLWVFRYDLQLAPPKPQPQPQGTSAHARPTPDSA